MFWPGQCLISDRVWCDDQPVYSCPFNIQKVLSHCKKSIILTLKPGRIDQVEATRHLFLKRNSNNYWLSLSALAASHCVVLLLLFFSKHHTFKVPINITLSLLYSTTRSFPITINRWRNWSCPGQIIPDKFKNNWKFGKWTKMKILVSTIFVYAVISFIQNKNATLSYMAIKEAGKLYLNNKLPQLQH